jgi:hypothetical protein
MMPKCVSSYLFDEFIKSGDSLQVFEAEHRIYSSSEKMLLPLLKYINDFATEHQHVIVFDKIVGNAAALLLVKARCAGVYTPLASKPALKTLDEYNIDYKVTVVVPYIQRVGSQEMCPMERLSSSKTPESFYQMVKDLPA